MIKQVSSFIVKHWQWMLGVVGGFALGLVSISYGAGVCLTGIQRDVLRNTEAIFETNIKVDANTRCVESLRDSQGIQREQLARIEEGVKRTDDVVNKIWSTIQRDK